MCTLQIEILNASGTTLYLTDTPGGTVVHLPLSGPQPGDLFALLACCHDEALDFLREGDIEELSRALARRKNSATGDIQSASIPQLRLNIAKALNPVLEKAGCTHLLNDFLVLDKDRVRLAAGIVRTDIDAIYAVCRSARGPVAEAERATLIETLDTSIRHYEQCRVQQVGLFQDVDSNEPRHRWRVLAREHLARRYVEMLAARDRLRGNSQGSSVEVEPASALPDAAPEMDQLQLIVWFAGLYGAVQQPVRVWLQQEGIGSAEPEFLNFQHTSPPRAPAVLTAEWRMRDDYALKLDWSLRPRNGYREPWLLRLLRRFGSGLLAQTIPFPNWTPFQPGVYEVTLVYNTRVGRFTAEANPRLRFTPPAKESLASSGLPELSEGLPAHR